jgi:hypothetical protein
MRTIILLPIVLFSVALYGQQKSALTSEQLKITRISNQQAFLENRIATLEYNFSTSADLWINLYTIPEEGTLTDSVIIMLDKRTIRLKAKDIKTEQRPLEITKTNEASPPDYTTAQNTHSSASTPTTAIQVNPDGTHSTIYDNGDTKLVVNPNGSHTVLPNNETSDIQVNESGKLKTQHRTGNVTVVVNPDGSHSTIFHNDPLPAQQPAATQARGKRSATQQVFVSYSSIHIEGNPELLDAISRSKTLTVEVKLAQQTISLAMFARPLERFQKKLSAAKLTGKK